MPILLVMAGGALGAAARHLVGRATLAWWGPTFPLGTLAVNIVGGLCMGLFVGLSARWSTTEAWRLFVATGVLGGFTTFSTFSLDIVTLAQRGASGTALFYAALSVLGAIGALLIGLQIARVAA